jgi:hypothetical protein|nr:MAG TPA: hypothetical protein [Caudoviricetes sp.]
MAKKEVDGVVVEAKSILTALRIIKTVCGDNIQCETCPLGDDVGNCRATEVAPKDWRVDESDSVWRALR